MALYVYVSDPSKMDDEHYARLGALVSWCHGDDDPVADANVLATRGLTVVRGLPELDDIHTWDEATHTVITSPAPVLPKVVATGRWILRFKPTTFVAIMKSNDPVVQQFVYALNHTTEVDLNDPLIIGGVQYLVSQALMAADEQTTVMA